jgi:DNA primase
MAKTVSKRVLEDIRFRCDIAEVVGSYIQLQRTGSSFKALCPFHKEKTPSFHVNPQRQIFHCFGCGAGGDVFKFVMQYEGLDFIGAVRMLAQRAGIQLELDEEGPDKSDKIALYRIHEELSLFFRRCLEQMASAENARAYLRRRQLDGRDAEPFRIGYAPDGKTTCASWARKNGVDAALLEKAGLVVRREGASLSESYDRFRDRIMFPIFDEQGRVIAFSGRTMTKDQKIAKYVNSPETPLFHKGRVLYALHAARRHMVDSREAIVCEGQIDVIRCHLAGFRTAVASQGTAFTEDHARVLRRYADSVLVVFDPDRAGQDAAIRTAGTFLDAGLSVRVGNLPPGEDPDSFISKNGADAFADIVRSARSVVGFQVGILAGRENLKTEAAMRRAVRGVFATIARTPDSVQRDALLQELGTAFPGLNIESLFREFHLQQRKERSSPVGQAEETETSEQDVPREEEELCRHLARVNEDQELVELVRDHLPLDMFSHPMARAFAEAALKAAGTASDISAALNDSGWAPAGMQEFAAGVIMAPSKIRGVRLTRTSVRAPDASEADAVKDLILVMWKRRFEDESRRLQETMKERDLTPREAQRRLQLRLDLKSLRAWETGRDTIAVTIASGD